jgi:predicted Fe-S protein YdhL (DUF1289 family)
MKHCKKCGKPIKTQYTVCFECKRKDAEAVRWIEYMKTTPQERDDFWSKYYDHECRMCGKEGASWYEPHGYFCSHCWTEWNS